VHSKKHTSSDHLRLAYGAIGPNRRNRIVATTDGMEGYSDRQPAKWPAFPLRGIA